MYKEALYYEKMKRGKVKCNLCPHECVIKDGRVGKCRVRKNEGGILYALNYGKVACYSYDLIERKPFYHFYPGNKIFSIGGYGCNLDCAFCQNWEISQREPPILKLSDKDVLKLAESNNSLGLAYTYNEPSVCYEYVLYLCKLIKKRGLKNVYITNGYINKEPLEQLLPYIDAMNIDLKAMDKKYYKKVCKGTLEPVLDTIRIASKKTRIEVTNLVINGKNNSIDKVDKLAKWLSEIDKDIPLHLTRYYPFYKMDRPPTEYRALMTAKKVASKYLNYVYVGNILGIDCSTYCPKCGHELIYRYFKSEITGIKQGKCVNCGYEINIEY